jgi:hypothetical protein
MLDIKLSTAVARVGRPYRCIMSQVVITVLFAGGGR